MRKEISRRNLRHVGLVAAAAAVSFVHSSFAASGSWTGADDGATLSTWADPGNWVNGIIPGVTDGTFVSPDVVTFAGTVTTTALTVDLNRNISGFVWTSPSIQFTVGTATGNAIHLTGGGTTSVAGGLSTSTSDAISAPIIIHGTSYTFIDNSTNTTAGLKLNGDISGAAPGQNTTIFLDGVLAPNATSSINTQVHGRISDGTSASVGIVKNGVGTWEIDSPGNSYSGDTVVNQGSLRLLGGTSAAVTVSTQPGSPNSNLIVNSGGGVRFNFTSTAQTLNTTYKSFTLNTGGTAGASNSVVSLNLTGSVSVANSASLFLNQATATGAVSTGVNLFLAGTTDRAGGVTVTNQDATGLVTWSKNIDLGNVNRPFNISASAANVGAVDFQVSGRVSGAGGIIKTGNGILKLVGNDQSVSGGGASGQDTFSGPLEIQAGAVRFNAANQLASLPALIVDGGTLNVQGFVQTFSNATVSSGTLQGSNPSPGTVSASSITMPVATGASASASALLAADSITKTGGGTFSSSVSVSANTLNVSGGAFTLNANGGNLVTVNTLNIGNGGKLDLGDNDLIVNYTGASPATTIRGYLASAFNAGNWNGPGIASKSAGSNTPLSTALGYAEESDVQLATLDGATPNANSVIVKYTYYGDTNLDGSVTSADFSRFLDGLVNHGSTWAQGDFTYDGKVDLGNDFNLFLVNYLQQGGALGALADVVNGDSQLSIAQKATLLAVMPEPSSLTLLAIAGVAASRRRRRD